MTSVTSPRGSAAKRHGTRRLSSPGRRTRSWARYPKHCPEPSGRAGSFAKARRDQTPMAANWNHDFLDLIDAFHAERVDYLVVGAFALAAHGFPRATGDIDFFVRPSADNASRLVRALTSFGAPLASAGVTADDFSKPGGVYQIGVVPRRIDVITDISGVSFDEAFDHRVTQQVDGRAVSFIGRVELVRNKRAAGRPKDLIDANALDPDPNS